MTTIIETTKSVDQIELERKVKEMYKNVALYPEDKYHFEMGRELAIRLGYPIEVLNRIPSPAIQSFAGVGYYFDLLNLKEGETVVDLGSGSGMDVFFALNQVGESGEVIGIDMTSEQLSKARNLVQKNHIRNVYFHQSYIEQIPIRTGSMDTVISNGVINLSANKETIFQEVARVLKPGGRMALADIISSTHLPESISSNATLWAACIGGATQKDDYFSMIESAGLLIKTVVSNPYTFISTGARGAMLDYGINSLSLLAEKK